METKRHWIFGTRYYKWIQKKLNAYKIFSIFWENFVNDDVVWLMEFNYGGSQQRAGINI